MVASAAMERIICVVGPTASGKTSAAIALAKERGGEVISVDSRQVYRTLDIGTEKASSEEMCDVPHHLIDIREPEETYSAGDFVKDAKRLIKDICDRGKTPILAGGTHFYFDALIHGLPESPLIPIPPHDGHRMSIMSTEELYEEIMRKDSRRGREIDPKNRRRLVRALELIDAFGKVPERNRDAMLYEVEWVVVNPEMDELKKRIVRRLENALSRGLIEEVRRVRVRVGDARLNELGLEYRLVGKFLRGECDEAILLPALSSRLFQYARRQKAWLRKLLTPV